MIYLRLQRGDIKTLEMILYCVQRQVLRTLVNSNHKSFSCTAILGSKSLYDDLGLDPTASSKDIKKAFIRLSKEFHPDKNPDNPEAAAKFFEISNAYNVLNNPKTRRSYDRGQLGRLSSVADRESASHQFEKQGFVDVRILSKITLNHLMSKFVYFQRFDEFFH